MKTIGYFSLLLLTATPVLAENVEDKAASLKAREKHYRLLHEQGIPGGAWFRYQAGLAREDQLLVKLPAFQFVCDKRVR